MDLLDTLKQFKNIEPDRARAAESRFIILNEKPIPPKTGIFWVWQLALRSMEAGSAIALAGVVLILILGGFGKIQTFSPLNLSGLDNAGLRAEAEAIDAQIQLTNLSYREPAEIPVLNSTPSLPKKEVGSPKTESAPDQAPGEASSPLPEISIDEALDMLTK